MTTLISAQLDAHDTLIRACLDGTLAFWQFVAAYGDFPRVVAQVPQEAPALLQQSAMQQRIAFHRQVAGVLAGVSDMDLSIEPAVMMRLRLLAVRYPDFSCGG